MSGCPAICRRRSLERPVTSSLTNEWGLHTCFTMRIWRSLPSSNPNGNCNGRGRAMRFDLADLSLFRHIVDAGSITHGAERANLALAAASTRIRNMEEALGAALLVRGRQGVQPTQAGRTLLQHARTMLRQAEGLRAEMSAFSGGEARRDS